VNQAVKYAAENRENRKKRSCRVKFCFFPRVSAAPARALAGYALLSQPKDALCPLL